MGTQCVRDNPAGIQLEKESPAGLGVCVGGNVCRDLVGE